MGAFFGLWFVLAALATVTTFATTLGVFRQVDLTFAQFATMVTAPLVQATVLSWRSSRPGPAIAQFGWFAMRHPLAQPVLWLDVAVLGGGVFFWDQRVIGLGGLSGIHTVWTLVKASAAVVFLAMAARTPARLSARAVLGAALAPLALVLALEPTTSWVDGAFAVWQQAVGARFEVLQRIVIYGGAFAALVALSLRSARFLDARAPIAAMSVRATVACAVPVAVAAVLATFNLPMLTQPWLGLALLFASCAASSLVIASIALASPTPGSGGGQR